MVEPRVVSVMFMEPTKISFKTEAGHFGLRAEGLMLHKGRVLLHRPETFDFWTFPGGGVHLPETFEETLTREWLEETGFEVRVKRLLYVIENFFSFEGNEEIPYGPRNQRVHGIGLCFLVEPVEKDGVWLQDEFYGEEDVPYEGRYLKIAFRWFEPEELNDINLVPVCLKLALKQIPHHPIHLVNREI